jgi:hypothetical protein
MSDASGTFLSVYCSSCGHRVAAHRNIVAAAAEWNGPEPSRDDLRAQPAARG